MRSYRFGCFVLCLLMLSSALADMGWWGWKNGYYRDIGSSKQFFIDDAIIEDMQGLKRILNQAKPYAGNPVIQSDQPWEKHIFPEQYGSVLYDEAESVFKMWYQVQDWSYAGRMLAYATSKDGLRWEKPILGVVEYRGSKENNFVFGPPRPPTKEELQADHLLQKAFDKGDKTMLAPAGEPFKDTIERDPAKRYKMLYRGPPVLTHYMVNAAYSPDGINWKWKFGALIAVSRINSMIFDADPEVTKVEFITPTADIQLLPDELPKYGTIVINII